MGRNSTSTAGPSTCHMPKESSRLHKVTMGHAGDITSHTTKRMQENEKRERWSSQKRGLRAASMEAQVQTHK